MKTAGYRMAGLLAVVVAMALGAGGCDGEGYATVGYVDPVDPLYDPCCYSDPYYYTVEVFVGAGRWVVPGAEVELVVASVPERRYYGYTDEYGFAYFEVEAYPDVTLVAYACAPGYYCDAADIGIVAGMEFVALSVTLFALL